MNKNVIYNTIGCDLKVKSAKDAKPKTESLSVEDAMELLGWVDEVHASKAMGSPVKFQDEFTLRDFHSTKVRCNKNPSNRPYRAGLTKRYANEMLRNKWQLNGETIIIDKYGFLQSGQHRLAGLVVAEQMRKADPERWKPYWKGPIHIDVLIVTGIDPAPKVVDTIDLGQKRSLGDVIYRNRDFEDGKDFVSDKDQKRLANILAHATRLVWLRTGGMTVSDAPNFPHSEALDFIGDHPDLVSAALFVYHEDGGTGPDGKKISTFISLGYAAALLYILGASSTNPIKYRESGEVDLSLWDKAEQFWVEFGAGEKELAALKTTLARIDSSGSAGRDEIVGTAIKAINLWMDGKKVDGKSIKMKKTKDKKTEKFILGENPRLGGIDTEPPKKEKAAARPPKKKTGKPDEESESSTPAKKRPGKKADKKTAKKRTDPRKPKKKGSPPAGKDEDETRIFTKDDPVTVKDKDGDWEGTYLKRDPNEDIHYVMANDDEGEYEVALENISLSKKK